MARSGVQQHQIADAAYALLMEGVRPTVEKVRHRLGTGSPNTISPMLDDWFKTTLPGLLRERPAANEVEGLPAAAVNAFRLTWTTALKEAAAQVEKSLEDERQALREAESDLAQQRAQIAREGEGLSMREEAMQETVRVAHEQAADMRRQVDELSTRGQHLQQTIDQLQGRGAALEQQLQEGQNALRLAREKLDEQAARHAQERQRDAERAAANERRHLQEIDRARSETAKVQQQLQDAQAAHRATSEKLEVAREAAERRQRELSETVAGRDRQLAEKDREIVNRERQLADRQAQLLQARESASVMARLAEANASRATELGESLAVSRRTEQDLRAQLASLQDASAQPSHGARRTRS